VWLNVEQEEQESFSAMSCHASRQRRIQLPTHFPMACHRRRTSLTPLPTRTLLLHRLAGAITPALRDL